MVIVKKKKKKFRQTNPMLLTTMGFFSLSKHVTTSFKPIYKCHGQQWGLNFFQSSLKMPQLLSNLINVINNDGF
jgi:hypothetical protein